MKLGLERSSAAPVARVSILSRVRRVGEATVCSAAVRAMEVAEFLLRSPKMRFKSADSSAAANS